MKKAVFGVVSTKSEAEVLVNAIVGAGFETQDVSVLMPNENAARDFAFEHKTKAPEGAAAGSVAGGAVGATLGLLAGIGTLAIPGLGMLIAAGPIMATLSGAAVGAAVGGVTGALVGMGIPEIEAKAYEDKIKEGGILVSVHCEDTEEAKRAKDVFERCDAEDVFSTFETEAPDRKTKSKTSGTRPY